MPFAVTWAPVVAALALYFARLRELRTRRNTIPGAVQETLTLRLFMFAGTVMLIASLCEFAFGAVTYNWLLFAVGIALGIGSFILRRKAINALGAFWSLHIEMRDEHQFVRSGPFRWMRHPTYFSMILELLSGGLILHAPWSLLAVSAIFFPTLWLRVKLEETALVSKFGSAYRAYQKSTPALIPYRWPRT